MKISISALSIAYGLTPEALRYYEEKGLLSPDRAASSGFRRFSIADVQRLGIIKSLQRQGFSLDEIKRILTKCALSDLIVMMDEKRAALREQIAQQNAVYERMTSGTDLLRDCRRLLMQPRLCMGCAAYLVDFDSVPALWTAVPKMPFLKDLIDALPLTETSRLPFASRTDSACHACGHDIHATALVGATLALAEIDAAEGLPAPVRCQFQPAEEVQPGGAQALMAEHVLDGVRGIFALHTEPKVDVGMVGSRIGPITAAT